MSKKDRKYFYIAYDFKIPKRKVNYKKSKNSNIDIGDRSLLKVAEKQG